MVVLELIKPLAELINKAYDGVTDHKTFVESVNNWVDEDSKKAALKIIEESQSMTDEEKLKAINELQLFINDQKKEAASEINKHQLQTAKIMLGILSAGISVPIDMMIKAAKNEKGEAIDINLDSEDTVAVKTEE